MSRQDEILAFIAHHIAENGYSPTVREIGKAVGLKSSSTVSGHIERLEDKGLIKHVPKSARSIVIVDQPDKVPELPEIEVLKLHKGTPSVIKWQGRIYVFFPNGVRASGKTHKRNG